MGRILNKFIITFLLSRIFSFAAEAQTIQSISRASLSPSINQQGESYSYDPEIDGAGRFVIFTSTADSFAADGVTLGAFHEHVYLRDTVTNITTQLDVTSEGKSGSPGTTFNTNLRTFGSSFDPHISRDGKYVVFNSSESNISPDGAGETYGAWTYLKNIESGEIRRIPFATAGDTNKAEFPAYLAINADGSIVVIISIVTDMTTQESPWEIAIYNRNTNASTIIDTGVTGNKFNPGISDDGRYLVFENQIGDFTGPTYSYLYDLTLSQPTSLNNGNTAQSPAISGDGAMIAYTDTSNFSMRIKLRERESGSETLVSDSISGGEPNGISDFASLSQDGRYTAFLSSASNLVKDDSNSSDDIFVYDRITGKTALVSVQGVCEGISSKEQFNTGPPSISTDGSAIAFTVLERLLPADKKDVSGNILEPADSNTFDDVYFAKVDFSATPAKFKKGLTPATPFASVNCSGVEARLQIEDILTSSASSKQSDSKTKKNVPIKKITRQIFVNKINPGNGRKSEVQRTTAKRNALALKNLPPGNYSAQVRADAKYKDGKVVKSRLSRPAYFSIGN